MAVPLAKVSSALEIDFVVLPDPGNGGGFLDDVGRLAKRVDTNLMQPLTGGVGALILVEPIAVKDRKMHFIPNLGIQRVEYR